MARKTKIGELVANWPVAFVMTGFALTVVWIAVLFWLSLKLLNSVG
jgi:hypothetical protein